MGGSDAFLTSAGSFGHMEHIHALRYINKCFKTNSLPLFFLCVWYMHIYEHVCCHVGNVEARHG